MYNKPFKLICRWNFVLSRQETSYNDQRKVSVVPVEKSVTLSNSWFIIYELEWKII